MDFVFKFNLQIFQSNDIFLIGSNFISNLYDSFEKHSMAINDIFNYCDNVRHTIVRIYFMMKGSTIAIFNGLLY